MRPTLISLVLLMSPGAVFAQPRSTASDLAAVKAAYLREFGESIEHPAFYSHPESVDCAGHRHPPGTVTTAYLTSGASTRLLQIYLSQDGKVMRRSETRVALAPAGTIRVLAVLVRYPATISADALALWENAQRQINEDHAAFARSRGYKAPIVVFANTNVMIDRREIDDPRRAASVRVAAERHGLSLAGYQIVMTIDINPEASSGGFSDVAGKSIYLGNFNAWKTPPDVRSWQAIATAAYHHEVGHHWGWMHDWYWTPMTCGGQKPEYAPLIVPPLLLGWEDLQGGHVPEILSDRPYGRSR